MSASVKVLVLSVCLIGSWFLFSNLFRVFNSKVDNATRVYKHTQPEPIIDDDVTNIFWFVQVTDIHISRYAGPKRMPDLVQFCKSHLSVIKPEFVLATGDLTDAKYQNLRGSTQFVDEWKSYAKAVQICREVVPTWLDQRGNHDAFDTPDLLDPRNLFITYSAQGEKYPSSYVYNHIKEFGKYSFISVDATPNPGPKRPFNFFGYIKQKGENQLEQYLEESRSSNLTFGFGHYPTSLIAMQSGNDFRHLLRNVSTYLCGHLHTMGNLIPKMYARHDTGMMELELGDWKDARIYRVMAVDHDMISVTDEVLGRWPVVLITNPIDASLSSPQHEPLWRMSNSSHIRMLVFTPGTVNSVNVYIDDAYLGKAVSKGRGPMFVLPWKPDRYQAGLHTLKVIVQDSLSNQRMIERVFSLDNSTLPLPISARFILLVDLASLARTLFYMLTTAYIGVLLYLRKCKNIKKRFITAKSCLTSLVWHYNSWLFRLWLITHVNSLFFPLVGYMIYVAVGPWFFGDILQNHMGVVFVWGMIVKNTYLPVCLTYLYGIFHTITFSVPLLLFLSYKFHYFLINKEPAIISTITKIYLPFLAIIMFQLFLALTEFPAAYGTRAFLLGPLRTGGIVLAISLYCVAAKMPYSSMGNPHLS